MRAGKGPGPAPRPQPDNSHPSFPRSSARAPPAHPVAPAEQRRSGRRAPCRHAGRRSPQPEVTVQAERLQHSVWNRSPGRARPLPPGGRARPVVGTRHRRTCRPGRTLHPRPASTAGLPARLQTPTSAVGCRVHRTGLPPDSPVGALGNWFLSRKEFCEILKQQGSSQVCVLERALWFLGGIVENRLLQRPDER